MSHEEDNDGCWITIVFIVLVVYGFILSEHSDSIKNLRERIERIEKR